MAHTFTDVTAILERLTNTSKAWHTKDSKVANNSYVVGMSAEQRRREEERDQDMAHMKTQIDLLTRLLLAGGLEKVKAVSSHSRATESDYEEEANYLNHQKSFRANSQGNQGRNSQQDNYYDKASYRDCEQGNWKNKNDKSGLYVQRGSRDTVANDSGKPSLLWRL